MGSAEWMEASEVYARLLAAVAAADGVIDDREVRKLAQLLKLDGGDPARALGLCQEAMANIDHPLSFMEGRSFDAGFAKKCLRDGLLIAFVDQIKADAELALLHLASCCLGVEQDFQRVTAGVYDSSEGLKAVVPDATVDEDLYLRLMAAVVAADGEIEDTERIQLRQLVRVLGFDPHRASSLCDEALDRMDEPLWFLPETPPDGAVVERMLKDCAILAGHKGEMGDQERELIDAAAVRMGVETPTTAFDEVEKAIREGLVKIDAVADKVFQLKLPPQLVMAGAGLMAVLGPMFFLRGRMGTMSGYIFITTLFLIAMVGMVYLAFNDE